MRALFVGRFQPFHNGHMEAIKHILSKCDSLIVLVGSSQKCYEPENPFTVGERIEMIERSLSEEKLLGKCLILSIPDIMNNALWVNHIDSLVPHYDIAYSNNALTKRLFSEAGKKVAEIPFFTRSHFDGTKIRAAMLKGSDEWRKSVPKAAALFIDKLKAVERIRAVADGDKNA